MAVVVKWLARLILIGLAIPSFALIGFVIWDIGFLRFIGEITVIIIVVLCIDWLYRKATGEG